MTVRELVNELTQEYVDWNLEVHVCVANKSIKSGEGNKYENYKIDRCGLFDPIWYEGDRCQLIFERITQNNDMNRDKIIKKLDRLKTDHPEQVISIETSNGYAECKMGDALIYEGINGEIVIDSE